MGLIWARTEFKRTLFWEKQTQVSNTYQPRAPSWCSTSPRSSNSRRNTTRLAPSEASIFNCKLRSRTTRTLTWHGNEYELVIMVMNSGVFVNERGTSSTFLGLLTKQGRARLPATTTLQQQRGPQNDRRRLPGQHPLRTGLDPEQAACGQGRLGTRAPPIRSDRRKRAEGSGLR